MREKRDYSVRTSALQFKEPRRKFFLVYEGIETEPIYFEALQQYSDYSKINPLIDMVPIIRGKTKEGWSNPYKLMNGFMADLEASTEGTVTYNTLIDCIVDEACPDEMSPRHLCKVLKAICTEVLHIEDLEKAIPKDEIESICQRIEEETTLSKLVDTIPKIIQSYSITYDATIDKIGFVIDRDRQSFVKNEQIDQYGYVLSKCRDNKFGFYLSNPCFEYWLLLHFEETMALDKDKLLENAKYNSQGEPSASKKAKHFTELELRKLLPGYNKSSYTTETLMKRIEIAIAQEKSVCENEEELEHMLGSRVGILIEELRSV